MIHDIPHLQGGLLIMVSVEQYFLNLKRLIALRFHVYTCSQFPL